ncbi:MAG: S1 RNA-binding domain-containing protein, partial [Patescibacteria group bacterium]
AIKDRINLDALVHISEISWEGVSDVQSLFAVGEEIEAVVVGFNKEAKRVELSIKKLTADPFTKAVSSLGVDQKVEGVVKNVDEAGVHVTIISGEEELPALIRKEKVPVGAEYIEGQELTVTISQVDTRRRIVYVVPVMLRKTVGYR